MKIPLNIHHDSHPHLVTQSVNVSARMNLPIHTCQPSPHASLLSSPIKPHPSPTLPTKPPPLIPMADQRSDLRHVGDDIKHYLYDRSPPASKTVAAVALFPIGGFLLALSGLALVTTVIGVAVTTPLFFLFSPVLVPAAVVIALAVAGFLASGAFGLTAVTALTWIVRYVRSGGGQVGSAVNEQMEYVKKRVGEAAGQVGQKGRDVGHAIQNK